MSDHSVGIASGSSDSSGGNTELDQLAVLRSVHTELSRLEGLLGHRRSVVPPDQRDAGVVPAWLRPTDGENRWPVAIAVVVAIALQIALPDRLTLVSRWLLPSLELVLLVALVVTVPRRLTNRSPLLRAASLVLAGMVSLANGWSAALLVIELVTGRAGEDAAPLLTTGAAIWLTNVIAFALWYWEFDRGGPVARAHATTLLPDFLFPQMQEPRLAPLEWEPGFLDYLYLSFTNATAFSPTDVLPLSRWTKMTMLVQSVISLVTVALVIARAVNILK